MDLIQFHADIFMRFCTDVVMYFTCAVPSWSVCKVWSEFSCEISDVGMYDSKYNLKPDLCDLVIIIKKICQ